MGKALGTNQEKQRDKRSMSKDPKNMTVLPGIDLKAPGFKHEKRERMSTKQQVESFIAKNTSVIAGQVRFDPKDFEALVQEVFDSAYNIGFKDGKQLVEWNQRMQ